MENKESSGGCGCGPTDTQVKEPEVKKESENTDSCGCGPTSETAETKTETSASSCGTGSSCETEAKTETSASSCGSGSSCGTDETEAKTEDSASSCGCGPSSEATDTQAVNVLDIKFLYLDLSTCTRCKGTDATVEEALVEMEPMLKNMGYTYTLEKIHINTEELAKEYAFLSSPTIRINGKDIVLETKESNCSSCGDVSGVQTDCRDWEWQGKIYSAAPKGLFIDAILKSIYDSNFGQYPDVENYTIPENVSTFLASVKECNIEEKQPEPVAPSGGCGCGC